MIEIPEASELKDIDLKIEALVKHLGLELVASVRPRGYDYELSPRQNEKTTTRPQRDQA